MLFSCCGGVGLAGWPAFPVSSPDGGNFILSDGNFMNSPINQTITGLNPGNTYLLTFYQALIQDVQPFPSSSYFITTPGPDHRRLAGVARLEHAARSVDVGQRGDPDVLALDAAEHVLHSRTTRRRS